MTALADVDDVTLLDIAVHGDCHDDPEWLEMLGMSPADAPRAPEPDPVHGEGSVAASAEVTSLLDRALRIISQFEGPHRVRRSSRARVTAHLPGQHNQESHGNRVSSPLAIAGIKVMDSGEYDGLYGEALDDTGVDIGQDGEVRGLNVRYFESGDLHVTLDLEDERHQVLEDLEPEGMRQLAYSLEDVLAVDETEFSPNHPSDIVADADSDKHGFYVAKDGLGDIRIQPPGAEDDDYLEFSEEQARDFVEKLLSIVDSYEEHFTDDGEVVAKRGVVAHLPGKHDQRDHGRKKGVADVPKIDAPKTPIDKKVPTPRKKATPKLEPKSEPQTTDPKPTSITKVTKTDQQLAAEEHVKAITANLPTAVRKQVQDALFAQAAIAPRTVSKLAAIGFNVPGSRGDLGGGFAEYVRESRAIDLNTRWKSNKAALERSHRGSTADGYLTPTGAASPLGAVVAHEFGHRMAFRFMDPQDRGIKKATADKLLGALSKALGVSPPRSGGGLYVTYPEIASWLSANRPKVAKGVSEYGSESIHELFGEAWQEFSTLGPKARPASRAVGQALLDLAEKGGGA